MGRRETGVQAMEHRGNDVRLWGAVGLTYRKWGSIETDIQTLRHFETDVQPMENYGTDEEYVLLNKTLSVLRKKKNLLVSFWYQ